jgi:uncharacterized protein YndB with AHSA1/START domain
MAHAEHEVVIERPIAEVFAFLADGRNDPQWREGILEIERLSPTDGLGTRYRQVVRGPGDRRIPSDYVISDFAPPHMFSIEVTSGPVRPTGRFDLTEEGPNRTRVRSTLDVAVSGAVRLIAGMISREFDNEVRQIERLKLVLEN